MKRTSPLRHTRRTAKRSARKTGPSAETRQIVFDRDRAQCVRCGRDVSTYPSNFQHRRPRGMGGTSDPTVNLPSNGIVLCGSGTTGCHGWVESHREEAHEYGWSIPWWVDATAYPVRYPDGHSYYLTDDGRKVPA
mgnify:CR=1 FL=1